MDITQFAPSSVTRAARSQAYVYATTHTWQIMYDRLDVMLQRVDNVTWEDGIDWYQTYAPSIIHDMSLRYDVTYERIAAVMAVFSATCGWAKNVIATDKFLYAYVIEGRRGTDLPAVTRNFAAVIKAQSIMTSDDPGSLITADAADHVKSWKTVCFYNNLCGMIDRVTVDVWMWRAMSNDHESQYRPEGWHYMMCESVIMALAEAYNVSGPDMQAILWVIIRGAAH